MATGIEMLGQMGTDQSLAGPVQGGNMVVKPNQVPVGGAAMLTKALRGQANKGVGGMYLLPEQRDQTPDFMKIAKSNVMRDIEGQRNQYPMNYAKNEGGIIPMLPRNLKTEPGADETTLAYITPEEQAILGLLNPGTPHIGPEQVPTYDSSDYGTYTSGGRQVTGGDRRPGGGAATAEVGKQYERDVATAAAKGKSRDDAVKEAQERFQARGREARKDPSQFASVDYIDRGDGEEVVDKTVSTTQEQFSFDKIKETLSENEKKLLERAEAKMAAGDQTGAQRLVDSINNEAINAAFEASKPKKGDDAETVKKKKRVWGDIFKSITTPGGLMPLILQEALGGPSKEDVLNKLKDQKKEGFEGSLPADFQNVAAGLLLSNKENPGVLTKEEEAMIKSGGGFTSKDTIEDMIASYKGGEKMSWTEGWGKGGAIRPDGSISLEGLSKSLSIADKRMLKDIDPEMYAKLNFRNTQGDMENLAREQSIDTKEMTRGSDEYKSATAFNRSIIEAREISSRDRGGPQGQRPRGMGGGAGPIVEDEVTEAIVEEGATTMPYTGPRTGGAEVNVPLSRRFALDPTQEVAQYRTAPRSAEDIYKYYTEGTEGEGRMLEPYGEFQKRRRKALGKEPLDFWSY